MQICFNNSNQKGFNLVLSFFYPLYSYAPDVRYLQKAPKYWNDSCTHFILNFSFLIPFFSKQLRLRVWHTLSISSSWKQWVLTQYTVVSGTVVRIKTPTKQILDLPNLVFLQTAAGLDSYTFLQFYLFSCKPVQLSAPFLLSDK